MSHAMRLSIYLLSVVGVTLIHSPLWLAILLFCAWIGSGPGRLGLLRRAVLAVLLVNTVISAGYLVAGWFMGSVHWPYLLLLNLRVLLLAWLTAWMMRDVDLARALENFPVALRWLSVVRVQIGVFQRLAGDYRDAFASRSTTPPTLVARYRSVACLCLAALDKAVYNAEAVTQAMRSRGALDD